jgi:hypothetical protein
MRRLPRRLALWGGAAAIAAGGFAFMASNSVAGSSLGEGAGTVTGYKVTNIQYTTETAFHLTFGGSTGHPPYYVTNISFTLTSDAATAPANAEPTSLNVTEISANGEDWSGGLWNAACKIVSWTTSGGAGTGSVTCATDPHHEGPVSTITSIDVEAHQGTTKV